MKLPPKYRRTTGQPTRPFCLALLATGALSSLACGTSSGGVPAEASSSGKVVSAVTAAPRFPLKLSSNQRYLVDQDDAPFLINQASSWGLIQALPTADAGDYMDALKAKGFNTLLISIISYDVRMAGNPPNWQGVPPFTTQWDYSTYNTAYFDHADQIINMAKDRGMLVELVASYLGYPTEPTQGWADEMLSANNSVAKSQAYGRFLGARYKSFSNVVWVAGGDQMPAQGSELDKRLHAIVDSIKEQSPSQLWTGHWDSVAHGNGVMASENPSFASQMDLNGYYAYDYDYDYVRDLDFYNRTPIKMVFHLDQSYEGEGGGTPENIRRKAYQAVLSGAFGSSFCAGQVWWGFTDAWRTNMSTPGTLQTQYWYNLFTSRAWQDLVPDQNHDTVTSNYGSFGALDYVTVARASSGNTVIAFLPGGRTFTVDMTRVSGQQAKAWWYDPASGQATLIGTYATSGSQTFSTPDNNQWVFVLDDAGLNLPTPGSTAAPPPSPPPTDPPPTDPPPTAPPPSNAAPTVATSAAASQNPVTGSSTSLSVLGDDDAGEPSLSYTWAATGSPPASVGFSVNGTNGAKNTVASFAKAGAYTLQATITDGGGLTTTSAVNVDVSSTLTSITASPTSTTVSTGGTQQFTALATDQFGFSSSPQPSFAWAVTGGGRISSGGLFTAGSTSGGPFGITATTGGKSGSASVTIVQAIATQMRINAGGSAVGAFGADQLASGGTPYSTSSTIATSGVSNAAPAAVYQTERYGNFSYTFSGLPSGSSHTVRLHFAEIYWWASGYRLFNVAINGATVLDNFDIFAAAGGMNKALVRDFTVRADTNGKLVITFNTQRDNAKVSAIELL